MVQGESPPESPGGGPWGELTVEGEAWQLFELGSLRLELRRLGREWWIRSSRRPLEEEEGGSEPRESASSEGGGEGEEAIGDRFVFREAPGTVKLEPTLADRPVVSRPVAPLHVPSGESVTVFVSSPLWVRISVGSGEAVRELLELPLTVLSDTWFGPSSMVGQLCYAARTRARMHLDEVAPRPHRAVTPVEIRNESARKLLLERLSLPVPHLGLYREANGAFWTESLAIVRRDERVPEAVEIGEGPPGEASEARFLRPPREPSRRGNLLASFSLLLERGA